MHNCIDVYIDHIKEFPNKLVLYSNVAHYIGAFKEEQRQEIFITENLKISQPKIKANEQFEILLRTNKVWAGSLFIARKIFDEIGYYDDSVRLWEDRPKLLPFLRQFLFSDKLVSCDRPSGRSQETKRPSGTLPSAFYIPIPDGAFPGYNTSYNPLFCDITPNHCLMVRDKASRI